MVSLSLPYAQGDSFCPNCDAEGYIEYNLGGGDTKQVVCELCQGTGFHECLETGLAQLDAQDSIFNDYPVISVPASFVLADSQDAHTNKLPDLDLKEAA